MVDTTILAEPLPSWALWLWANKFVVAGWIVALVAFVLVPFRRPPAEARSWLLIFFGLPWVALVVYALIGRPYFAADRKARIERLPDLLDRIRSRIEDFGRTPELSSDNRAVERLAMGIGGFSATSENRIETLDRYEAAYDAIVADILAAEHHVHLEFYIFRDDRIGEKIIVALEQAAARGVTCRVLVDALGSYGSLRKLKRRLRSIGAQVHDILPLRRRLRSSRVDLRNHRKVVIVDGKIGYIGSQNIWDPTQHSRRTNKDLLLRIEGPAVSQLQAVFALDWYLETLEELVSDELFPRPERGNDRSAQIVATGPENPEVGVDLIFAQAIYNAAERVVITTPYFVPNDAIISAIKAATLGGVRVCLITSERSDNRVVGLAQRSYYSELLAAGLEIYRYGPDFLHAKHFRVDYEVSIVGTSNMDMRSFELNAEIDLISFDADFAQELQQIEDNLLSNCERLSLEDWRQRSLWSKVLENTARLMADLI
ncbi:MAG: cardiolipin synthase [Erythrobacter sp.]|uniref:cardiolipin synthase n=1 Tax=Erythrobacter sp. TaxID=1042 RepID=UPI00262F25F6|nr:cardiolipin synthase [Erythrobacter sp.]MDJ0977599.1 cardiolipin synthase [Erythrobacter sp.]